MERSFTSIPLILNKPQFTNSHFISTTLLIDLNKEKFDSPTNKKYIQSIYNLIVGDHYIDNSNRLDGFRVLGDYYHKLYKIDEAIKFYNQGLTFANDPCSDIREDYLCILYINLANLYIDLNELNKARLLIERTIELDLSFDVIDNDNLGIDYCLLAKTYRPIDSQKSLFHFLQAKNQFNLIKQRGENYWHPSSVIDLYIFLADNYLALGNIKQAELEIDTALMIANPEREDIANLYRKALETKGVILQHKGAYQKALKQYRLANKNFKNGPTHTYQPKTLLQMARCYLAMNQPAKAYHQLETAFTNIDQNGPPHQSRVDKVTFPKILFQLYYEQAKVLTAQYKATNEIDFLLRAQKAYQEGLKIFEIVKHSVSEVESRKVLMKNNTAFFESALDLNFQVWEQKPDSVSLNAILFLSEKSKNNILFESINKSNPYITNALPDSINQQIKSLDLQISQTEKKLFQAELSTEQLVISATRDKLIRQREKQKILMQHIKENYPYFYQLKYQNSIPTIAELQKELLPEEGILSYYIGVNHIYTILIDRWDSSVKRIPMDFSLSEKLDTFNYSIIASKGNTVAAEKALIDYHHTGFFLYQKLIAPFTRKLPKQLTILPDNLLENLSFDALLTELPTPNATYKDYPFLQKKYNISYQYSADAITRSSSKKEFQHSLLAFAPTFSDNKDFSVVKLRDFGKLSHNITEVDNIKNILGNGLILKGEKATEDNFMKLAPDYQIIHLATHGKVNLEHSNYSYLAFQELEDSLENELLYIKDIYGLQLKADLVVLSACETANGSLTQGEGIVNLARGFTYAGASAVVPTLWKISDIATADLMEKFYMELKMGQPKNLAMANAKQHFLENTSPQFTHPFYWAAFVMIGDTTPILLPQTSQNFAQINIINLGIGTIFFLFFYLAIRFAWRNRR